MLAKTETFRQIATFQFLMINALFFIYASPELQKFKKGQGQGPCLVPLPRSQTVKIDQ